MMTHGREKRLLLILLALLAPLPLPFNEVVSWPALALYGAGIALALRRTLADRGGWLSPWTLNLLGVLYLPIFILDLTTFSGGRLVAPVVNLGLFTVAVRLFSLTRERDKWQALMGIFFLFLASMATSVHLSVALYLLAFVVLSLLVLARFAYLHLLTTFGRREDGVPVVPMAGFLALSLLLGLVLAVPLFAILPRVASPYISAPGRGPFSGSQTTGFSDEVTLSSIGRIRTSREVALRFQPRERVAGDDRSLTGIRLKGGAFDRFADRRWERTEGWQPVREVSDDLFRLAQGPAERWLEVYQEPLGTLSLLVPVETTVVRLDRGRLQMSDGGVVRLTVPPTRTVAYTLGLASQPVQRAAAPDPDGGALDTHGLTPAMADLARQVMGPEGDSPAARAERLIEYLHRFEYTLDNLGSDADNPLEDFLLRDRRGHCELFASSMVLLLRSQGIPARLATGFLGAEYNPLQGYYIVRQSNAHAWVEAYLPELGGWATLDPTPPAGRPLGGRSGLLDLVSQAYDYLVFRWDRYILSYDTADQFQLFLRLREVWLALSGLFGSGRDEAPVPGEEAVTSAETGEAVVEGGAGEGSVPWAPLLGFGLAGLAGLWVWWRRRAPLTATAAYGRIRRELARGDKDAAVSVADPPLAVGRVLLRRLGPEGEEPARRVMDLYLSESFGGRELTGDERLQLERSLKDTLAGLKKAS
jgi:protein-glutamine gamma-glutamyltransferase